MSRLIPQPLLFFQDADGSPLPGALAYTYLSLTSTPVITYQDAAQSIEHPNPIVAQTDGYFPAIYAQSDIDLKIVLTDASGANPRTIDPASPFRLTQTEVGNVLYPSTLAEDAVGITPVNSAYTPLNVWRYMTSAQIADVTARTLTLDCRAAIQTAISVAQQTPGGEVYIPSGAYLIRRVAGLDSQFNGIVIPYTNVFGYIGSGLKLRTDGQSTTLYAGDNNMTVVRWSESHGRCDALTIDVNGKTGVSGLSLISSNTASAAIVEHIDHNEFHHINIVGCAEGIELESPSLGGCYYNKFFGLRLYNNTRHIRFRDNATSGGANRNKFYGGECIGGNCGAYIDGADTTRFFGMDFEAIAVGASPIATPTAIYTTLQGSLKGFLTSDTNIIGCIFEGCTKDLECNNRRISILGGNLGAVGIVAGSATPDVWIGGDAQYLARNLLMGSATADGLSLSPRQGIFTACPQVFTSSNQIGSFPFNVDGALVLQGRQHANGYIALFTGTTPTERLELSATGRFLFQNCDLSLGQSATAVVITNGSTIAASLTTVSRVAPAGAVTGVILQAGSLGGQQVIVINESANSVTFAAAGTSNVADGTGCVIAANKSAAFHWSTGTSRWYCGN